MLGCPVHRNQTGHSARIIDEKKGKKGQRLEDITFRVRRNREQTGESSLISFYLKNRGKM